MIATLRPLAAGYCKCFGRLSQPSAPCRGRSLKKCLPRSPTTTIFASHGLRTRCPEFTALQFGPSRTPWWWKNEYPGLHFRVFRVFLQHQIGVMVPTVVSPNPRDRLTRSKDTPGPWIPYTLRTCIRGDPTATSCNELAPRLATAQQAPRATCPCMYISFFSDDRLCALWMAAVRVPLRSLVRHTTAHRYRNRSPPSSSTRRHLQLCAYPVSHLVNPCS